MASTNLDDFSWPQSLRGINDLSVDEKRAIYRTLVPEKLLQEYSIDFDNAEAVQIACPADTRSVEIRIYLQPDDHDPMLYLQMVDTLNFQIAILLLVINDLQSPRYNVDITETGLPTHFGTFGRNIPEEVRAMKAGLSPGQVRQGLRLLRDALITFERFLTRTGHDLVIIEPLTYNNAILYERYGFAYVQGKRRMEWINEVLRPGGSLYSHFDHSSPFRYADAWKSVRGRSWAIHDGILGEPYGDIRMYKRVGERVGLNTFPDGAW